jgi:3-oxoacyl-[acyl-carrier protein] reductase
MNIIITGTSRGIGENLAKHYLALGHIVFGCGRQNASKFEHNNFFYIKADVSIEQDVQKFVKFLREKHITVDVLINNAGIANMNHFLLTPTKIAANIMNVNFMGTFMMCRQVARLMRNSSNAIIINFTTVAVPMNLAGEAIYASSKAAVEKLTRILAKELAEYKIRVNAIGPTPIDTKLTAAVPKEKLKQLINHQAIQRMGEFADVTNVCDFFIQPASEFITGQILYLGGVF